MENQIQLEREKSLEFATSKLFTKVYVWMFSALLLTALVSSYTYTSGLVYDILSIHKYAMWGLFAIELAIVWILVGRIENMSFFSAFIMFVIYSAINGITLSTIFISYDLGSIASAFYATAGTFGAMSLYGYFTKKDLSSWGNILFMGVIGLVIASIVNMFFANSTLYWIITYAGVIIFVGLTAYNTQNIKQALEDAEENESTNKIALLGSLSLYINFINMFLYILRILKRIQELSH